MPDTKDWTWVLERPCPECGVDAAAFPTDRVAERVREIAAVWPGVLGRAEARQRPDERTWSPLEYGCHVRDVLRLYDERLRLMLDEDDPLYPNWDQDATALQDRYGEQGPARVAEEIMAAGDVLAERFAGLSAAQWERPGRRSDGARFTVASFARYLVHDLEHHLHDVGVDEE